MTVAPADEPHRSGRPGVRDRLRAWRNALVANPRFQRICADVPLLRRIGERHANALFDLCAGFVYSQILLAVVRLDLLSMVRNGPLAADEIARRTGLATDAARRLADAAVALGLLEKAGRDGYALGLRGAALAGTPGLAEMILHHGEVYADFADPVDLLSRGRADGLGGFWDYDRAARESAARYSRLMAATQGFVQADVLDAYDFGRHRAILDVGGGDGSFLAAVGRRWSGPTLAVFDRPAVADLARARFQAAMMGGRARAVGGDFRDDGLPPGADLVTLIRVLHDHDDAVVRGLLAGIRRALAPGGRLLIAEPMAETPGAERVGHAYFGFYLLAMGQGRPRSVDEIVGLMSEAGFVGIRPIRTRRPGMVSIVTGLSPTDDD